MLDFECVLLKADRHTADPDGFASPATLLGCLSRPLGAMLAALIWHGKSH